MSNTELSILSNLNQSHTFTVKATFSNKDKLAWLLTLFTIPDWSHTWSEPILVFCCKSKLTLLLIDKVLAGNLKIVIEVQRATDVGVHCF